MNKLFEHRLDIMTKGELEQMLGEFTQSRAEIRREKYFKGLVVDSGWHDSIIQKINNKLNINI